MLNRYFLYSGGLHIFIAAVLFFAASSAFEEKPLATYTIDFLGSNFQAPVSGGETPAPPAAQPAPVQPPAPAPPAPEVKAPEIAAPPAPNPKAYAAAKAISKKPQPKNEKIVLGTPSILNTDKPQKPAPAAQPSAGQGSAEAGAPGIKTDFPDFPYPWYITQVRSALWDAWTKRKPLRVTLSTQVSFSIKPDGTISDVKVSKSSGNDAYDYAAKTAAEGASPFPPLPKDFGKPQLTVTVEFKDE